LSQTEVQSLYNNNTILNQQVLPSTTAVSLNTNATLDLGGLNQTIGSLSGSSGASVLLSATTNVNKLTVGNSSSTIFGGTLSGNGSITKNGTGTLTLSGLNTMAGNVNINGGTLTASSANQWNILATASALGNPSTVGRTVTINSGAGLNFGNGNVLGGPQSGKRPVLALAISGVANAYSGDMNTLGPITLNGGTLTTANGFNSSNQSFYLGGGLVTVSGSAASTISAGGSSNNGIHLLNGTTFNVADATGDANADLSVSAALMDQPSYDPGTGSLTKTGAGTMILSGANTYTGPTTVSAGTLLVSGTTSTGQVVIGSGGTLGGSGTIGGAVTNQFGGTLTPGGGLTTLKVNNNVTLQSGSMTVFEISKTAQTNDKLVVSGALSYGGTLVVTNLAGTFAGGENFQLFQAGSINGSFSSNSLPALSAGLAWNTNSLGNGTLSVIQTTPTNLMWSVSSTNLNLSWPAGYLGWHLQFQTNAPGIGLGTNWMNVLGSSFTNNVALPVDATQGSVFYRLTYP
jgi:autotransporter-associated beta strand protein